MLHFDLPRFLSEVIAAANSSGDLLFTVGCPPQVLVDGGVRPVPVLGLERLTPFQTEAIAVHLLAMAPPGATARWREQGAAHFAYSVPGFSRFRAAVFSQRGSCAVTLRAIPDRVPTLDELHLPEGVREACRERSGIVLVNGPTNSGRTTTLAAMIGEINSTRACHVETIEDPIEYLHRHGVATVNQREVGIDTPSIAQGLADALRHGAHVLMVSGVCCPEEARLLLEAAETGHLVLSSMRGLDTATALARLLCLFPPGEREEARARAARTLRWSFTQQLVPHRDGRRPVVEVWRATRATVAHLMEGNLEPSAVADLLRDGENQNLLAFDRALEKSVRAGLLSRETALAVAAAPRQLELRLMDVREGST